MKIADDREGLYVVIAYRQPPPTLMMHQATSGRIWFKRCTGFLAAKIVDTLKSNRIRGRVRRVGYLAGTPSWVQPPSRRSQLTPASRRFPTYRAATSAARPIQPARRPETPSRLPPPAGQSQTKPTAQNHA